MPSLSKAHGSYKEAYLKSRHNPRAENTRRTPTGHNPSATNKSQSVAYRSPKSVTSTNKSSVIIRKASPEKSEPKMTFVIARPLRQHVPVKLESCSFPKEKVHQKKHAHCAFSNNDSVRAPLQKTPTNNVTASNRSRTRTITPAGDSVHNVENVCTTNPDKTFTAVNEFDVPGPCNQTVDILEESVLDKERQSDVKIRSCVPQAGDMLSDKTSSYATDMLLPFANAVSLRAAMKDFTKRQTYSSLCFQNFEEFRSVQSDPIARNKRNIFHTISTLFQQDEFPKVRIGEEQDLRLVLQSVLETEMTRTPASTGVLLFRDGDRLEGSLKIRNTFTRLIAFRVDACKSGRYEIQPNQGLLQVDESVAVSVTTEYLNFKTFLRLDTFEIKSTIISGSMPQDLDEFWRVRRAEEIQSAFASLLLLLRPDDPMFLIRLSEERNKCRISAGSSATSLSISSRKGAAGTCPYSFTHKFLVYLVRACTIATGFLVLIYNAAFLHGFCQCDDS